MGRSANSSTPRKGTAPPKRQPGPARSAPVEATTAEEQVMGEMQIALMRGINVGGKNRLPMAELIECFEAAGCTHVRTYIQSGNVVFLVPADQLQGIGRKISKL